MEKKHIKSPKWLRHTEGSNESSKPRPVSNTFFFRLQASFGDPNLGVIESAEGDPCDPRKAEGGSVSSFFGGPSCCYTTIIYIIYCVYIIYCIYILID